MQNCSCVNKIASKRNSIPVYNCLLNTNAEVDSYADF